MLLMRVTSANFSRTWEKSPRSLELAACLLLLVCQPLLHLRDILLEGLDGIANLAIQLASRHLHEAFQLGLDFSGAEIQIIWTALRSEILLGKLLEIIEGSATLVVLEVGWVAILQGWVAADTMLLAQVLALGGAVNISHQRSRRI